LYCGVILIVFDASTLILLAKIDILQLVLNQYSGIIPEIVKEEVIYKNEMDTELIIQQIKDGNLAVEKNPSKDKMKHILKDFPLGRSEVAALIIAKEKDIVLVTDDGLAIKVCKIFGVKFATAIHFLIGEGLDKSLTMAKLKLLKKYGRYSADIIKDAEERIRKGK
jgi:predicted nucleic acid-binding protein